MTAATPEKKIEFVSRDQVPEIYRLLDDLLKRDNPSLAAEEPKIAIAWMYDVKPDRDDHLTWGKTKKCSDLDNQLHGYDFVISLNFKVWNELPLRGREALMAHEIQHCAVAVNDDGESVFYLRKHDLEEFVEIVRRYGLWREDLKQFVDAALGKKDPTLFDKTPPPPPDGEPLPPRVAAAAQKFVDTVKKGKQDVTISVPGGDSVTITGGGAHPATTPAKSKITRLPADPAERAELEAALANGAQIKDAFDVPEKPADEEPEPKRATRGRARAASDSSID